MRSVTHDKLLLPLWGQCFLVFSKRQFQYLDRHIRYISSGDRLQQFVRATESNTTPSQSMNSCKRRCVWVTLINAMAVYHAWAHCLSDTDIETSLLKTQESISSVTHWRDITHPITHAVHLTYSILLLNCVQRVNYRAGFQFKPSCEETEQHAHLFMATRIIITTTSIWVCNKLSNCLTLRIHGRKKWLTLTPFYSSD